MSAWIWVLASLSLRHTLFEWATELPSRWKGELGRRCDCVCNPQLKAEYYLVLSDYDTSPWRSAKGSTLDPSLAGLASVASCPGSPSYRRRCADAATDSGGEEAPLQQLAGVAVSVSCESFTERGERPPAQPCLCGGDTLLSAPSYWCIRMLRRCPLLRASFFSMCAVRVTTIMYGGFVSVARARVLRRPALRVFLWTHPDPPGGAWASL